MNPEQWTRLTYCFVFRTNVKLQILRNWEGWCKMLDLYLNTQEIWQYWASRPWGQQLARDELGQLPSGGTDASQLPWLPAVSQCHPCHVPPKGIYSFVSGWAPVGIWVYSLYPDLQTTKPSLVVSPCWVRKVPVWDMKIPPFEKVERRGKTTRKLIVP